MCLKCNTDIMKVIIDWFGQDIHTIQCKNCCFVADVFVSVSPTFFGWVFSFGGKFASCIQTLLLKKTGKLSTQHWRMTINNILLQHKKLMNWLKKLSTHLFAIALEHLF